MIEVSMRPCLIRRASEKEIGLSSKMALALKVLGASVFATQYPDFNFLGMQVSALYVSTMVAYRLTQRFLLDRIPTCPVASLTMIDALVSLTISGFMSRMEIEDFGASMKLWWNDSSICTMLLLSFCTFSVGHWAMLHLIRCDTATSTMVIQNISSGFAVINGILYFNDKEFERPFAFAGILLVISGGMWWTILQSLAVKETKPLDAEKDSS
ncbi:unnamed protein product [Effrenium voratum]|nr:unnamed protein product [Effrenium voratum]